MISLREKEQSETGPRLESVFTGRFDSSFKYTSVGFHTCTQKKVCVRITYGYKTELQKQKKGMVENSNEGFNHNQTENTACVCSHSMLKTNRKASVTNIPAYFQMLF